MSRSLKILLLVFVTYASFGINDAFAVKLKSAKAASQADGRTLLVLTFDKPAEAVLKNESGDLVEIDVQGLTKSSPSVDAGGLVSGVLVESGKITVLTNTFVQGTILPAGSGLYVLTLKKTSKYLAGVENETKETEQKRTSSVFYEDKYEEVEVEKEQPETNTNDNSYYDTNEHGISWGTPTINARKIPITELSKDIQKAYEAYTDGDPEKATKILKKIGSKDKDYGWARLFLGNLAIEEGNSRRALDLYHQAMKEKETRELASVKLALEFQRTGNRDAAMTMWEKVFSIIDGRLVIPPVDIDDIPVLADNDDNVEKEIEKTDDENKKGGPPIAAIFGGLVVIAGSIFGFKFLRDRKLNKALSDLEDDDYDIENTPKPKKVINLYDDNDDSPPDSLEEDEDIPWGGDKAAESSSSPAFDDAFENFEDEMDEIVEAPEPPKPKSAPKEDSNDNIQGPKLRKIEALHKQGATVREIAETLGIGQDEVRMVIRLVNDEEEI